MKRPFPLLFAVAVFAASAAALRAADPFDPLAGDSADPFAGSSDDPFAAGAAETAEPAAAPAQNAAKPAHDPLDPFAAPPGKTEPAYDPLDPFAAPPPAEKRPAPTPTTPAPAPAEKTPAPARPGPESGKPAAPADAPEPPDPFAAATPDGPPPGQTQQQQPQQQQPQQQQQAQPRPPAASGGWLSDTTPVEIDAAQPGVGIGPFEKGDLLVLRYKSGEWTSEENRRFKVKPDVPRMDARERLVLVAGKDVVEVPGQTDAAPFVYTVETEEPVKLRIGEDPGQDHEHLFDNAGVVTYLACVIGAEDAGEFRASSEGRRCQFAKTAAERLAEEEEAARKAGDPFVLDSTKDDGECDFDFTQNGGLFTVKSSGTSFGTHWSRGPNESVVFADATRVRQVGGKPGFKRLPNSTKAFDDLVFAPGSRTVHKGEVVVFQNAEGRMLAVRVDGIRLPNPATGAPGKLSIHWRAY